MDGKREAWERGFVVSVSFLSRFAKKKYPSYYVKTARTATIQGYHSAELNNPLHYELAKKRVNEDGTLTRNYFE